MKHINLSLIIILLSFSFIGAVSWWTVGNEGSVYSNGGNFWLYSSPFANQNDNHNFTYEIVNYNKKDIRIAYPLNDYSAQNLVYYFDGNSVYVTDIYGDITGQFSFDYSIDDIYFINYLNDEDLELLVRYNTNNFAVMSMTEGYDIELIKTFSITSLEPDTVYTNPDNYISIDFNTNRIIYLSGHDDNIIFGHNIDIGFYNIDTDEQTIETSAFYTTYDIENSDFYLEIDSTTHTLYFIYFNSYYSLFTKHRYEVVRASYYLDNSLTVRDKKIILDDSSSNVDVSNLQIIKIRDKNYLVITGKNVNNYYMIYSTYLDSVVNIDKRTQNIAVGDVDLDGIEEICSITDTYLECYNNGGILEFKVYANLTDIDNFVMANYENDNDYLEIITPCQLLEINKVNDTYYDFNILENFSYFDCDDDVSIYPVILLNKIEYVKDLIISSSSNAQLILSDGIDSVCGDGICSFGETMVTCPNDCLDNIIYNYTIFDVVINPSIDGIWEKGTKVKIEYSVKPSNDNVKYQTQTKYSINDGLNWTYINEYDETNEKTKTFTSIFYANNLTEEGIIRIEVRTFSKNTSEFKDYDFIVRNNGISYGDSYYSEKQTEETIKQDNGIYKAFLLISSMLDLSVTILYLLVTVVVMGGVAYGGTKTENFNSIINVLVIGFILLLIGTLTGCLPASIIVTISIIGIIVLALGFKNHLSGSREG